MGTKTALMEKRETGFCVKETWHQRELLSKDRIVKYRAGGDDSRFVDYDGQKIRCFSAPEIIPEPDKWTPSIFMPRWASRINLTIRMVEIERIQMIGPYAIEAEGLRSETANPLIRAAELRDIWIDVWNGINGKPRPIKRKGKITRYHSFPWSEEDRYPRTEINGKPHFCFPNPWVWVIKFERAEK